MPQDPNGRLPVSRPRLLRLRWDELAALRPGCVDFLRRRFVIAEAMTEVNVRSLGLAVSPTQPRQCRSPASSSMTLLPRSQEKTATISCSPRPPAHRCATGMRADRGSTRPQRRSANRA
jgi:hypothetical protein